MDAYFGWTDNERTTRYRCCEQPSEAEIQGCVALALYIADHQYWPMEYAARARDVVAAMRKAGVMP